MSFITYVLLFGLFKGLGFGKSLFTPDLLIQCVWRCLVIQIIESCVIKFGVNVMQVSSVSFLDIFAYTGYKYVGLCVNTLSLVLGRTFNFVVTLFTSVMVGFFFLKTTAAVVPSTTNSVPPRHLLLLGFAALQLLLLMVLSWL
jgi:hypothetical protein